MSLRQISSDEDTPPVEGYVVTPSDVLEYVYCPRFIYFMNVLRIPQHQEKRHKVQRGREVHRSRAVRDAEYLRKHIGCVQKEVQVRIYSERLGLLGIVDEVLTLNDGTMAPLDYKWAEWEGRIHRTHEVQSALYGMLIEEEYGQPVERGFVIYTRSGSRAHEVMLTEELRSETSYILQDIQEISRTGTFPDATGHARACPDCCYRNVCPGKTLV